jgi:glycosyltransferase involved in cell wall biosynthesis/peptidoglycan/xylan/chitin deacetylase (PgdA/CDA1 family)
MRILFLSPTLGIGGSETLTFRYATHMQARGHEAVIAYAWVDEQVERLEAAGVRCVRVSPEPLTGRTLPSWRETVRELVAEFQPTVVHAQSVTAALAARLGAPGVPLLVTLHGLEQARDERRAALLLRLTGGTLTAVSQRAADSIRRYRPSPRIEVLPGGLDVQDAERAAQDPVPDPPGHPHFCCVARVEPIKGVDVLIRAFALALPDLPGAGLTLVGGGTALDDNVALAAELGISERLHFTGRLPNALPYIRSADIGVLPSRREGLPVVALETLALGRPLVATDVGGTPTVVRDGETGWLVPPEDPAALARALVEAGSDLEEAARRGRAGRRLIEEEFDATRLYDRLESLLLALSGEPPAAHERRKEDRRQGDRRTGDRRQGERRKRDRRAPAAAQVPPLKPRPWYMAGRGYQRARLVGARRNHAGWDGVRIFGYHRVSDDGDVLAIPPDMFHRHMSILAGAAGVEVIGLETALEMLTAPVEGRYVCITFDDAFADVVEQAAPILAEFGFPATVYVPTAILDGRATYSWYAYPPPGMTWEQLRVLVSGGLWSAQAHSQTHPRLSALPREAAVAEIAGSKADLEERLGQPVTSFAYPAGLYSPREVELVAEAGFRAGLTCLPGVNRGGEPMGELRRTMIAWGDREPEFRAKLTGVLDRPAAAAEWLQRRRVRARSW